jgi:PAS domain S-box-containing protein
MKKWFSKFITIFRVRDYSLRTKIIVGTLIIEVITFGVLAYFALTRASQIVTLISSKFENSVQTQTEAQLTNTVNSEAAKADQLFLATQDSLVKLVDYRVQLENQTQLLGEGAYWDAHKKIIPFPAGQYGNSPSDIASVTLPSIATLNEDVMAEMNTSAYLDFAAPGVLKSQSQIVAIYYISTFAVTTYYPNINLISLVPADFDARTQPFYTVADPKNDPDRLPRWTAPYQDPAGTGLIVTVSAPVYNTNGTFKGVLGIDMQLAHISENISQIHVGTTGFAFLVDRSGHILAMPPEGYALFGLQPEVVPVNESPQATILGQGSTDLQMVTTRLTGGESGLSKVVINGVETYIVFTPLNTPGYSLGVIVPVSELNAPVISSRQEIQNETSSSLLTAMFILVGLLAGAILLSFTVGQVIAAPLIRLTQTAEKVAGGDFNVQAKIESQDEIGILAGVFNRMTQQLFDFISSLEKRVAERTQALSHVAEISTAAAGILDTQEMLTTVVHLTQRRFGLYHAHVFLYDETAEELKIVACGWKEGDEHEGTHGTTTIQINQEQSLVARAARTKQAVIVNDVRSDPAWLPNPLLPNTASELAIPMLIGEQIVGVLDVQSDRLNAFTETDASIQTTLGSQVAIAVQNATNFSRAETTRQEAQSLVDFASEGILILDLETGLFADPNESAQKIYGLSRQELVKVGPAQMSPPKQPDGRDSNEKALEMIGAAMQTGANIFEWLHINGQGQEFLAEIHLVRLPGAHPRLRVTVTDITERRRNEELIKQRGKFQESLNLISQKIQGADTIEAALQIAARELGHALGMKPTLVALNPAAPAGEHKDTPPAVMD